MTQGRCVPSQSDGMERSLSMLLKRTSSLFTNSLKLTSLVSLPYKYTSGSSSWARRLRSSMKLVSQSLRSSIIFLLNACKHSSNRGLNNECYFANEFSYKQDGLVILHTRITERNAMSRHVMKVLLCLFRG